MSDMQKKFEFMMSLLKQAYPDISPKSFSKIKASDTSIEDFEKEIDYLSRVFSSGSATEDSLVPVPMTILLKRILSPLLNELSEFYPDNLIEIFINRFMSNHANFNRLIHCEDNPISAISTTLEDLKIIAENIFHYTKHNFDNELIRFEEHYKENIIETIRKATEGESKSILKLVKWDKFWITTDIVKNFISCHQDPYDRDFFLDLSDALSKHPGFIKSSKYDWTFIKTLLSITYPQDYKISNSDIKELYYKLLDHGILNELFVGEDDSPILDYKVFKKYLRRHNLIH